MTNLSAKDLIAVFPLFDSALANYIHENGESKIFEAGEVLMRPGQYFKYAMLIVDGKVKLYRESEEGEEFFMYYLERGNACALSMLCMARSESSTVMALAQEKDRKSTRLNSSHT